MKNIIRSGFIVLAVAAIAGYGTYSYFSDTETSTGNTFTAGAIDLKIDDHCWYNGNECKLTNEENPTYTWGGVIGAETCSCTWEPQDIDEQNNKLFFSFKDLKPGDYGEDTISLHVDNNDAWGCAKLDLTANKENDVTEPEGDLSDNTTDGVGELPKDLQFAWWADDGDNVLETDEKVYYLSPLSVEMLFSQGEEVNLTLADKNVNFFTGEKPNTSLTPLVGKKDYWIGKAWCFGKMTLTPVQQDPNTPNDPAKNPGFTCEGQDVTNISQSDSIEASISFTATQKRNNLKFDCPEYSSE